MKKDHQYLMSVVEGSRWVARAVQLEWSGVGSEGDKGNESLGSYMSGN